MAKFILTPHTAAGAITNVPGTPATGLKTLLQIQVPAATYIDICGWGVSFAGTAATDVPAFAYLMEGDVAATVGTAAVSGAGVSVWNYPGGAVTTMTLGTGATGWDFGTEGTIAATRIIDAQRAHPQTGYSVWFPDSSQPRCGLVASARNIRLRVNFVTAGYQALPWIVWEE